MTINLAGKIAKQLPEALVNLMQAAGEIAANQGQGLYLVGGTVRDLLLGKNNLDLDLVVEGDAISLAQQLAQHTQGKITTHPRFGTARLQWDRWTVDLATARTETYARPGALPTVKSSSIAHDLFRRDFTINAMAVYLTPRRYGELIDLFGGTNDLEFKLVRILHEKSFIDDATRIWRAIRYEQRLGFHLETKTLKLLKRDIPMLETISGDRIWYEMECIFKEEFPEKVLRRAEKLGVLAKLHPSLKGDGWLAKRFRQSRKLSLPDLPPVGLYLSLLVYTLSEKEIEYLISYLKLPKLLTGTLRDTVKIKAGLPSLSNPQLTPSAIYHLLSGCSPTAITANSLATDSTAARRNIRLFLNKLRYVKSSLTGNDLKKIGISPGPRMKEILSQLRDARLDGKIKSRKEAEKLAKEINTPQNT